MDTTGNEINVNSNKGMKDGTGCSESILSCAYGDSFHPGSCWRGIFYACRQGGWGKQISFIGWGSQWAEPCFSKKLDIILMAETYDACRDSLIGKDCFVFINEKTPLRHDQAADLAGIFKKIVFVAAVSDKDSVQKDILLSGTVAGGIINCDPFDLDTAIAAVREAVLSDRNRIIWMDALLHEKSSPIVCSVDREVCTGCSRCIRRMECPALTLLEGKASIDRKTCAGCTLCLQVCPWSAIQQQAEL